MFLTMIEIYVSIHHNNEIAQSESVTGKPLANYWLHGAFLNIKDSKMAKSNGGFITLKDLSEKGYSPLDYRYLLLTAHWSTALNFSYESLDSAKQARQRLVQQVVSAREKNTADDGPDLKIIFEFTNIVNNNLDMPEAVSFLWKLVKSTDLSMATFDELDKVLGLNLISEAKKRVELETSAENNIPEEVMILVKARDKARSEKNWSESDKIRDQIVKMGYEVLDTPSSTGGGTSGGTTIKKIEL